MSSAPQETAGRFLLPEGVMAGASGKKTSGLAEIRYNIDAAREAVTAMEQASTGLEVRRSWEEFLGQFGIAINRLITNSKLIPEAKVFGYKLENASMRDDPGLCFLREARNVVYHGLEPVAEFSDPFVSFSGNAIHAGGSGKIHMTNCVFDGRLIRNLTIETRGGRLDSATGSDEFMDLLREVPASIRLKKVHNPEKGRVAEVPEFLDGKAIAQGDPRALAAAALQFLTDRFHELEAIWP